MGSPGGGQGATTCVRMVAQPASVPAARRFVSDTLAGWGRADMVDDIGLIVTELATNVTLHSRSSHFDVVLSADERSVRLTVVDSGTVPAHSIAARTSEPVSVAPGRPQSYEDVESMTGRGLFIVSALAASWGIDDLPGGTQVWAEFVVGQEPCPQPPLIGSRVVAATLPVPEMVIHLLDCPPRLLLAHDEHLADLGRDLSLYAASRTDRESARSAERIAEVVRLSALTWVRARAVALAAIGAGLEVVDIEIAVQDPADLPRKVEILQRVTRTADVMAADGRLMALPASTPVRQWRDWVASEMVAQATTGREPESFEQFLSS